MICCTRWRESDAARAITPVGTEALLGCGFVEIHVGHGIWQTVSASDA
ncbi:hypothetical protein BH20ACT13_BH20ACT13_21500 [soil metagenome]